ncbi:hypothetical protein VITFI_CDS2260 [Vitreoscilla filiformis]|uniref:Uncharacterized protein n=1 Tax=Vitreoscilla filiformis TaxID=63 RepID=A0A221KG82_VITFI|nr:hypothetical protein VITFI_CDS2260 [Vitreoscilla filiformis]
MPAGAARLGARWRDAAASARCIAQVQGRALGVAEAALVEASPASACVRPAWA